MSHQSTLFDFPKTALCSPWRLKISAAVLLLCLVGLGYANSLTVPFVFDDYHAIVRNREIQNWERFVHSAWWNRPRALVDLTFALQWHLHKTHVLPYHLANMIIHGLNSLMAYILSIAFFRAAPVRSTQQAGEWNAGRAAFWSAAFFAVHPLQTQAVTYIVQRYTSMAALFYMGAVLCYLKFRAANRLGYALSFCALSLASFLCKQNALTLPITLLFIEWLLLKDSVSFWHIKARRLLVPTVVLFAGALWHLGLPAWFWSLAEVLNDVDRITRETPLVSRTAYFYTQLRVLCRYLLSLPAPFQQSVDHGYPFVHSFLKGWTPLAALALMILTAAAWSQRRSRPMLALGHFWFLSTLSLESSIFPIRDAMMEHRLYMPILGYGWVFAFGIERLRTVHRRAALALSGTVLCLFLAATVHRNQVWNNPIHLWKEALDRNPSHYRPANNLGRLLLDAGREDEAEPLLLRARTLNPLRPNIHFNLGLLYARRQQWDLAAHSFRTAILLDPPQAGFHYNLGLVLQHSGLFSQAQDSYEAAWILDPTMEEAPLNLAGSYFQRGDFSRARDILEAAMAHNPESFRLPYHLSMVYHALGSEEAALRAVDRALSRNSEDRSALFQKAALLAASGALREALPIAEALHARYPNDQQIAILLDKIRFFLGEPSSGKP